jgi:hypothetical protein
MPAFSAAAPRFFFLTFAALAAVASATWMGSGTGAPVNRPCHFEVRELPCAETSVHSVSRVLRDVLLFGVAGLTMRRVF